MKHAAVMGLPVVIDDAVEKGESGELEGALILAQEASQDGQRVGKQRSDIDAQRRRSDLGQRFHRSQPRDFVAQPVQKYGKADVQLVYRATVSRKKKDSVRW